MDIYGLLKLTLLDYPGKVACTVFTGGCNFRCPFCHNTPLVEKDDRDIITEERFFDFLSKRQGVLDAVCISGGEPLLAADIIPFMEEIKKLGFSVKLDTNGSMPEKLISVIESGFCDYVAMDIKNSIDEYSVTSGTNVDTAKILESIEYIKICGIEHEFRTTVVKELHTEDSIRKLTALIKNEKRYFLQPYKDSENVMVHGLSGFDTDELHNLLDAAQENVPNAQLRGI